MRDQALAENYALFRIKPEGHPIQHHIADTLSNSRGIGEFGRQTMAVGHKKESVVGILLPDPVFKYAVIMTAMQFAARSHAADNALFHGKTLLVSNRSILLE